MHTRVHYISVTFMHAAFLSGIPISVSWIELYYILGWIGAQSSPLARHFTLTFEFVLKNGKLYVITFDDFRGRVFII